MPTRRRHPGGAHDRTIRLGRERLGRLETATQLEWLVTNGIGGYAAGTVGGALTRRYHGLLVAALKPPVERTLLLAKLAERVHVGGAWVDLDLNEWVGGAASPLGHLVLESFALESGVPVWTWAIGNTRLEKRVWMEQGQNTTYVQYRLAGAPAPVTLSLRALVNCRDHHVTVSRGEGAARTESVAGGLLVRMHDDAPALWLLAEGAEATPANVWYRNFALRTETERGLDDREDHLLAGEFSRTLEPGEVFTFVASTRHDAGRGALALAGALHRRHVHGTTLLDAWEQAQGKAARSAPEWIRQLVLAADQFVVERSPGGEEALRGTPGAPRSVLAGYPWFTDWGRDTMIALPGLALTTGRPEIARAVLQAVRRERRPRHAAQLLPRRRFAAPSTTPWTRRCGSSRPSRPTSTRPATSSCSRRSTPRSRTSARGTNAARASASRWIRTTGW